MIGRDELEFANDVRAALEQGAPRKAWRLIIAILSAIGVGAVADDAQRINSLAIDQEVKSAKVGCFIADHFVVQCPIATCAALDLVVEVVNHFGERNVVSQHGSLGT